MRECPQCGGRGFMVVGLDNRAKETCPRGHPYDSANTYINPKGWRLCRTCRRQDAERRRGGMALRVTHYAPGSVGR